MQHLSITLYQPETILKQRMPAGAAPLKAYIEALEERLSQPEFGPDQPDGRALVVALHADGRTLGWAIDARGLGLATEQGYLEQALSSLPRPEVCEGLVMFAIHYAAEPGVPLWSPLPRSWFALAGVPQEQTEIEAFVLRCFDPQPTS